MTTNSDPGQRNLGRCQGAGTRGAGRGARLKEKPTQAGILSSGSGRGTPRTEDCERPDLKIRSEVERKRTERSTMLYGA